MVTIAQLATIPYLDATTLAGRFLPTLAFHDHGWRLWLPAGERRELLIETKGVPAEACYFARAPEASSDLHLPFLELLAQRANYSQLQHAFGGIIDDIFNLAGSLAKFALLEQSRDRVPHGLSRMVTSEVEYVLMVVRSLFDLFQEAMMKIWDGVVLFEPRAVKHRLKTSFSDMLSYKGLSSDTEIIAQRFGLPIEIASCYARSRQVFDRIKRLRDNIVHHGSQLPNIYGGKYSFLIAKLDNPFPDSDIWRADEYQPNDLVPLLPVLETLVYQSFAICNDLAGALQNTIKLPPPIVPGMLFFARGYFTEHLVAAILSGARRSEAAGEPPT